MTILESLHEYLDAKGVSPETLQAVADLSQERHLKAGELLFRADQESDRLYIVTEGQVDIQYLMPSGKRQTFDVLEPGDFGGWSAVVEPHTTSSIGVCRTPTTVVAIDAVKLRELCRKDTDFGFRLLKQMARVIRRRLRAARQQIAEAD
jgi:CRP/FNR family transcriptional regulator, anaerobic regulatory protein